MRHIAPLILFVISGTAFAASPVATVSSFQAALAAGDLKAAASKLSPGITIFESGYVERSKAEYAEHHMPADAQYLKTTKSKILHQNERVEGALAFVATETETTGTYEGKPVHSFGTETAILEQKNGDWRIVHFHWSSRKE